MVKRLTTAARPILTPEELETVGLTIIDTAHDEELTDDPQTAAAPGMTDPSKLGTRVLLIQQAVGTVRDITTVLNVGPPSQSVMGPIYPKEIDQTIIIKPAGPPSSDTASWPNNSLSTIVAVINYQVGSVLLQKKMYITSTVARFLEISARAVQVSFYMQLGGLGSTFQIPVDVAIIEGHHKQNKFYAPTLLIVDGVPGTGAGAWYGEGALAWISVMMTSAGGASATSPQYLVGCDLPAVGSLVSGTTPIIPGTLSTPLVGVGSVGNMSDASDPGCMGFSYGLVWALSSTTNVYTAPASSGAVNVQYKVIR